MVGMTLRRSGGFFSCMDIPPFRRSRGTRASGPAPTVTNQPVPVLSHYAFLREIEVERSLGQSSWHLQFVCRSVAFLCRANSEGGPMFHPLREPARSQRGRPNCFQPALEELETRDVPAAHVGPAALAVPLANAAVATASLNGPSAASQMPAFYEDTQVTVNMNEQHASDSLIAQNKSINTIYAYADLDDEQPFAPVINAN